MAADGRSNKTRYRTLSKLKNIRNHQFLLDYSIDYENESKMVQLTLFSGLTRTTRASNLRLVGYTSITLLLQNMSFRCIRCMEPWIRNWVSWNKRDNKDDVIPGVPFNIWFAKSSNVILSGLAPLYLKSQYLQHITWLSNTDLQCVTDITNLNSTQKGAAEPVSGVFLDSSID